MKFSWKWLNHIIDLKDISLDELINKLILAGFEIEEIIDQPKIRDKTINLNITANRADVNNIVGLGREISTILGCQIFNDNIYKKYNINQNIYPKTYNLIQDNIMSDAILDIRYNTILNLKPQSSPLWLKTYLKGSGIKTDNIINDLIQYINIKWGQDIEAFDLDQIIKANKNEKNHKLKLERLRLNSYNNDLSGFNTSHSLKNIDLIKYNQSILSILGIESNSQFCCNLHTYSIIIISKIYNPKYIQNIISENKIKTEISNKHLKGISRNDFLYAYEEIINLFINLNQKCILGSLFKYSKPQNIEKIIDISQNEIQNVLGPIKHLKQEYITQEQIITILKKLNLKPKYKDNIFSVKIPEYRNKDIIRPIDVIEEISRIYGFNQFIDKLPKNTQNGDVSNITIFITKIRYILRNIGLHEVINYSLEKPYIEKFSSENILLYNPLLEEQSILRYSLIHNLLDTIKHNKKNKNIAFECFEIGKIFNYTQIDKTYNETLSMASIIGNPQFSRDLWSEKNKSMNWFQAKGLLEDFFEKLKVNIEWNQPKNLQNNFINKDWQIMCHPHRVALLSNRENKENIGIFFQLNTKLKNELNINYELYLCEINIFKLMQSINYQHHLNYNFTNYSNYPSVIRDISFTLNKNESVNELKKYILSKKNPLIESIEIFNEYRKTNLKQGINNRIIGLRITYRSNTRTLNDQDIKNIDIEIKNLLQKQKL